MLMAAEVVLDFLIVFHFDRQGQNATACCFSFIFCVK